MRTSTEPEFVEHLEPRRLLSMSLLGDFNTTTLGSWAREPVVLDGIGYMFARDGEHGTELWRTDGTAAGTWMVTDINPGAGGSGGFSLQEVGGLLYFPASDATGLVDLWRSDGTADGTVKLTDVGAPSQQFLIGNVIDLNGTAIFGVNGRGIWRSDGTFETTRQIVPYGANSDIARLGDYVYFFHRSWSGERSGLWRTDGTTAGTTIVRAFAGVNHSNVFAANNRVYFWASDDPSETGTEPWSSDGTAKGTVPLGDLAPGATSSSLVALVGFDDAVYFIAEYDSDYDRLGFYRTDGTPGSITAVADLNRYNSYSYEQPEIAVFNGAMYFRGSRQSTGSELWRSDGTTEGTGELIDLNPGAASSYPTALQVYNGRLYFKARTETDGVEMYSTDGTAAGTRLLKSIAPGKKGIDQSYTTTPVVFDDRLFFRADDALHGMEMWSTDGTAEGTTLLKDIHTHTNDFNPTAFTAGPGNFHYFVGRDGLHDNEGELWKTDGTAAGTTLVRDFLYVPPWGAGPLTYANDLLLFGAVDAGGYELWRSDGTDAGTFRVKDIAPGNANGLGSALIKVGNRVFFAATTESGHYPRYDLWISDGTEAGTRLVKPSDDFFALEQFSGIELNGKLVFHASSYSPAEWADASIFISDGTPEGTVPIKDGFANVAVTDWAVFNGNAYFAATKAGVGKELWSTDGTEQGTAIVADINPGPAGSSPGNVVVTPTALYFTATDPVNGQELWGIDHKTSAALRLTTLPSNVKQVKAGARNDVLLTTEAGELYRFDGSDLIALRTSGFTAVPSLLGSDANFDYFAARTDAAGTELWTTDGTPGGTVIVQDLIPGPGGSFPQDLSVIDGRAYVSASIPTVGRELFVVSPFASANPAAIESRRSGAGISAPRAAAWSAERTIDLVEDENGADLT